MENAETSRSVLQRRRLNDAVAPSILDALAEGGHNYRLFQIGRASIIQVHLGVSLWGFYFK